MDWSQISIGAIGGSAATWLLNLGKTWFEHHLAMRRKRAEEDSEVRAEQREAEKKEAERRRAREEQVNKDSATLMMIKTRIKGTKDLVTAARIVTEIHSYFVQLPGYLNPANRAFLEKYPEDFFNQVCFAPGRFEPSALEELKRAVDRLEAS